ncbi:hypothetical protein ABW19_dt0200146 [Dactylella cylindrospora]|nr:hypothetical protein ABW19_dt0200146 [Dactylella cylindrospora]
MAPKALSSLATELVVKILKHVQDLNTLQSTLLSSRIFYIAYNESKESIKQSVWNNDNGRNVTFCKFLTHGMKKFLSIRRKEIPAAEIKDFLRLYLRWAHPSSKILLDEIEIPRVPALDLENTYKSVLAWTEKFCQERLQRHPMTLNPVENYEPPTRTELARIAGAFYQFWIFHLLYGLNAIDVDGVLIWEEDEDLDPRDFINKMVHPIAQSLTYLDFVIVRNSLTDFIFYSTARVMNPIKEEPAFLEMCRKYPTERVGVDGHGNYTSIRDDSHTVVWNMVSGLGPEGLWKFVFEYSYEQQLQTSLIQNPERSYSWVLEVFSTHKKDEFNTDTYNRILRICREDFAIKVYNCEWWEWWNKNAVADTKVAMWDDWRLEQWGYKLPTLEYPLVHWDVVPPGLGDGDPFAKPSIHVYREVI